MKVGGKHTTVTFFGTLLGLVLLYIQYNFSKSMVHLILGINFGFFRPYNNFFTKLMLCNIILEIIKFFIIYIERSMSIFIIYIGTIGPQFCFDYIKFRASLVIKIINFNEFLKNGPSSYACHLTCGCDFLSKFQFIVHLSCLCGKKIIF